MSVKSFLLRQLLVSKAMRLFCFVLIGENVDSEEKCQYILFHYRATCVDLCWTTTIAQYMHVFEIRRKNSLRFSGTFSKLLQLVIATVSDSHEQPGQEQWLFSSPFSCGNEESKLMEFPLLLLCGS